MAICKHLSSKNSSYQSVIRYMEYEHKESKNGRPYEPIYDDDGNMIKRENCEMMYINSAGEVEKDYNKWVYDCFATNKKYNQNNKKTDRKNHMYVWSFNPEDREKITMEMLKEMAKEFAKQFEGYQVLIAIHRDKDHDHIHFIINSCRDKERAQQPYMALNEKGEVKDFEIKAGAKHQDSPQLRYWLNDISQEISIRHGLDPKNMNDAEFIRKSKLRTDLLRIASESKSLADYRKKLEENKIILRMTKAEDRILSAKRVGDKKATRLDKLGLTAQELANAIGKPHDENMAFDKQVRAAEAIRDAQIAEANKPARSNDLIREALENNESMTREYMMQLFDQLEKDIKSGKKIDTTLLESLKKIAPENTAAQLAEMIRLAHEAVRPKRGNGKTTSFDHDER